MKLLCWLIPGVLLANPSVYEVIRKDDLPGLRSVLRKAGPDVRDSRGTTPAMYAAAVGSLAALRTVVEAGADVNAANDFGATALMWCAGDREKVRYLLAKGAGVTARSRIGRTPLMIAAFYDGSAEIGRWMIAKGADVNAKDQAGMSVLAAAAFSNNLEFARMLVARGADVNSADGAGFTPLGMAAFSGNRSAPLVKLLLEHGAKADAVSIDTLEMMKNGPIGLGRLTPLLFAAGQSSLATVELLVKAGADVNARDIRGMTPLSLAVATDHADPRIVRLLLAKGARGETALDWARKYRNPEILAALGAQPMEAAEEQTPLPVSIGVRAAIERSVALLQRESPRFLAAGGCLACHAQHQTGMAVRAAKAAGVPVDWELEKVQVRATASLRGALEQTLLQVVDPPPGTDGHFFSLLQMSGAGLQPNLATDSLVFHLAALQRKEGDWPSYGPVRPPMEDGGISFTAKGIRVLRENLLPGRKKEMEKRIARAAAWLDKATPLTTEDRTMQLLGLRWAGRDPGRDRIRELVRLQRSNGGWAQTAHLPADAYATGEALWALHETGMPAGDPVYQRGVAFLLRTQHDDGSWHVRSRAVGFQPYFESGFPHGHDQWISQSGTAWAVIALSYAATMTATGISPSYAVSPLRADTTPDAVSRTYAPAGSGRARGPSQRAIPTPRW